MEAGGLPMHGVSIRGTRGVVLAVVLAALCLAGAPATAAGSRPEQEQSPSYRAGQLVVRFDAGSDASARRRAVAAVDGILTASGSRALVDIPRGSERAAMRRLSHSPAVEWAEPNYIVGALGHNIDEAGWNVGPLGVDAEPVWSTATGQGFTGVGARVAVIDSGVDATHPQLAERVEVAPEPFNGVDDCGHGTAVAGVIAAAHDGRETVGVAPGATVLSVKALTFDDSAGECIGDAATVASAIDWAADPARGAADVINLSLGLGTHSRALADAVAAATARGVTVVAAAGDAGDRRVMHPAAEQEVISVAGIGLEGQQWAADADSSFGKVDLAAPSRAVPVILAAGVRANAVGGECPEGDDHTLCATGTSFAAPHAAGVAALLAEQHKATLAADPASRAFRTRQWLLGTAKKLDPQRTFSGLDLQSGHGVLNAPAARKASTSAQTILATWAMRHRVLSPTTLMHAAPAAGTATLRVSSGTGEPRVGQAVAFSSGPGATVSPLTAVTDATGSATVDVKGQQEATRPAVTATYGSVSLGMRLLLLERDDDIVGLKPTLNVSGGLNARSDLHDVYRVPLREGEILRARVHRSDGTDYHDVNVFGPNTWSVLTGTPLREAAVTEYHPLVLRRTAKTLGDHFLSVTGVGSFRLSWSIESPAVLSRLQAAPQTISPDGDGYAEKTQISWRSQKGGTVSVRVVDSTGRTRRTMGLGWRSAGASSVRWTGRDDDGRLVADGLYRTVVRWENGKGRFSTERITLRVAGGTS